MPPCSPASHTLTRMPPPVSLAPPYKGRQRRIACEYYTLVPTPVVVPSLSIAFLEGPKRPRKCAGFQTLRLNGRTAPRNVPVGTRRLAKAFSRPPTRRRKSGSSASQARPFAAQCESALCGQAASDARLHLGHLVSAVRGRKNGVHEGSPGPRLFELVHARDGSAPCMKQSSCRQVTFLPRISVSTFRGQAESLGFDL